MRWAVHGERTVYDSPWVRVALADVEVPGGQRFDHHVVRASAEAVGVVVHDPGRGVLLPSAAPGDRGSPGRLLTYGPAVVAGSG